MTSEEGFPVSRQVNFHWPAEWEPHKACIILYPHNKQTFRLPFAQKEVDALAQAIATEGNEIVYLYCHNEIERTKLSEKDFVVANKRKIQIKMCPSNDTWARDTAPLFCYSSPIGVDRISSTISEKETSEYRQRDLIGVDWAFNAYGGPKEGCYWPCDRDQQVAKNICSSLDIECRSIPNFVLEGGSIHTDGEGTILTTKECLLNPNRNPQHSQDDIEKILKNALGASKLIWLPNGLNADEDTNGHVDNFCCFVKPGHVALAWTDDNINDSENYHRCREANRILESSRDGEGRSITVHKLYLPPPLFYTKEDVEFLDLSNESSNDSGRDVVERKAGQQMAASYINFYIANTAILVPQFGVKNTDEKAIKTLQGLFPNHTAVGIPSREILIGGGNIHCMTQQVPLLR